MMVSPELLIRMKDSERYEFKGQAQVRVMRGSDGVDVANTIQ